MKRRVQHVMGKEKWKDIEIKEIDWLKTLEVVRWPNNLIPDVEIGGLWNQESKLLPDTGSYRAWLCQIIFENNEENRGDHVYIVRKYTAEHMVF